MGVHRQSEATSASGGKPRYQIRGHPDFHRFLNQLKRSNRFEDKKLAELVDNAMVTLEERPTAGESVPRNRWPKAYADLKLPNLYRYRLDRIHRMLYSIVKLGSSPVFVWIIETMDHTKYNQVFGYD